RPRRTASPTPSSASGTLNAVVTVADVAETVCRSPRLLRNSAASRLTSSAIARNSSAETRKGGISSKSLRQRGSRQRHESAAPPHFVFSTASEPRGGRLHERAGFGLGQVDAWLWLRLRLAAGCVREGLEHGLEDVHSERVLQAEVGRTVQLDHAEASGPGR